MFRKQMQHDWRQELLKSFSSPMIRIKLLETTLSSASTLPQAHGFPALHLHILSGGGIGGN